MEVPGLKEPANDAPPSTCPVCGLIVMRGFEPLCCPSLVMSTNIRGWAVPMGKVYLCNAVRRVVVSSTRTPVDWNSRRVREL